MNTFRAIRRTIPSANWMKYAALRTLGGITVSLGLIFGVIPFCVFLAIRISGVMTENHKE